MEKKGCEPGSSDNELHEDEIVWEARGLQSFGRILPIITNGACRTIVQQDVSSYYKALVGLQPRAADIGQPEGTGL